MTLSVVLAGGGTTGHVAPLLSLADCLRRRDPDTKIVALGTERGLEARLVPAAGYELALMPRVPLPRRPGPDLFRLPGRLSAAVAAASRAIKGADVVVGFGGYVSAPAYLAARRLGVPIVVHEANARPGVANRLGARITPYVAATFPGTPLAHAQITGLPLRRQITTLDRVSQRETARVALGPAAAPDHAVRHRRLARGAAAERDLRRHRGGDRARRDPGAAHRRHRQDRPVRGW